MVQEKGKHGNLEYQNSDSSKYFFCILGIKRFAKSLWKTFKADFGDLEERISAAKEEVSEEIKLASEQAEYESRELQMIETRENQVFRLLQSAEAEENRRFRSQQMSVLAETRDRRVQKIIMEEGRILRHITGDSYLITLLQNATESDSCRKFKTTTIIEAYAKHIDYDVKEPVFGSFSARNSRDGSTKSQTPLYVTEFVS